MPVDIEFVIEESIRRIEEMIREADEGFGQALVELIDLRRQHGDGVFHLVMQHVGQEIQERRGRYVLNRCLAWIDACCAALALDPDLYDRVVLATRWHSKALAMAGVVSERVARWALDPHNGALRNEVIDLLDQILRTPYDSLPVRSGSPEGTGYVGSYSLSADGFDVVLRSPSGEEIARLSFRCNPNDVIARQIHAHLSRLMRRLEGQGVEIHLQ